MNLVHRHITFIIPLLKLTSVLMLVLVAALRCSAITMDILPYDTADVHWQVEQQDGGNHNLDFEPDIDFDTFRVPDSDDEILLISMTNHVVNVIVSPHIYSQISDPPPEVI